MTSPLLTEKFSSLQMSFRTARPCEVEDSRCCHNDRQAMGLVEKSKEKQDEIQSNLSIKTMLNLRCTALHVISVCDMGVILKP